MTTTIGFIGTGNMGAAIIRGLAAREDLELVGTDLNRTVLDELAKDHAFTCLADAQAVADAADYVVLAVKPQHLPSVMRGIELDASTCLVSIAAGVPQARLRELSGDICPVVRVMPNTPALVGAGVFAVCLDDALLDSEQREFLSGLFASLGDVHVLPEGHFDAFTAVVGSGPAYVLYFMEALIEAAVTLGLTRQQAADMVLNLFDGTAKLAQESDTHVSVLREMVTSPGGTTARGLNMLDRRAVRAAIIDAVEACHQRSVELGE